MINYPGQMMGVGGCFGLKLTFYGGSTIFFSLDFNFFSFFLYVLKIKSVYFFSIVGGGGVKGPPYI